MVCVLWILTACACHHGAIGWPVFCVVSSWCDGFASVQCCGLTHMFNVVSSWCWGLVCVLCCFIMLLWVDIYSALFYLGVVG